MLEKTRMNDQIYTAKHLMNRAANDNNVPKGKLFFTLLKISLLIAPLVGFYLWFVR
jgi:hypothetical protein